MPSPAILLNSEPTEIPDPGLFSDKLVSAEVAATLPPGYRMRALRRGDYASGFLDCLRVLTTVGDISEVDFQKQYDDMLAQAGSYYILVIEDAARKENAVVATGALIVERKLYVNDESQDQIRLLTPIPASTALARSATLKTLPSPKTSRARSSAYDSFKPSTTSPPASAATRPFSTAARPTRASTSSAASVAPVSRWLTTTKGPRAKVNNPPLPVLYI